MVVSAKISISTRGNTDIIDITNEVQSEVAKSGLRKGVATIFVPGATGGLTTIEYEPGLVQDLKDALERLVPSDGRYAHDTAWGDGNGHSHIRASLVGPSISVPFIDKELILGTWQQLVFCDFDTRTRKRSLALYLVGEE